MNKKERRDKGKNKLKKLRFLYDLDRIYWWVGNFKDCNSEKYWQPSSQNNLKTSFKTFKKKTIRQQEKSELKRDPEEFTAQLKGNKHRHRYSDWET